MRANVQIRWANQDVAQHLRFLLPLDEERDGASAIEQRRAHSHAPAIDLRHEVGHDEA